MITTRRLLLAGIALIGAGAVVWQRQKPKGRAEAAALYAQPMAAPEGPLNVYHLGHSLVGRDMPAMLAQLVDGHRYDSQLGWGAPLHDHWEPDAPVNGFAQENDHPRFRPAREAVSSGGYDALVLTEMVEIRDAIRYFDSADYLARWAGLALGANANTRCYLYETWHHTDDPAGWLARIDQDFETHWKGDILYPALAQTDAPIYLIPAGQVMAAFVRRVQEAGGIDGITGVADLFATQPDGAPDTIHFNDIGAYLVALTHYAVLYHRDPTGLPHALALADGTPAKAPSAQAAQVMQETVWQVVRQHPETGVQG